MERLRSWQLTWWLASEPPGSHVWLEIQGVGLCGVLGGVGCVELLWGSGSFQMLSIQTQTVKRANFCKNTFVKWKIPISLNYCLLPAHKTFWTHLISKQLLKRLSWSFIVYIEEKVYFLSHREKKIQAQSDGAFLQVMENVYYLSSQKLKWVFPYKQLKKMNNVV